MNVLYEDNQIIVVEKPQNMLSQGDKTEDIDLLTLVKNYIKEKYNKPGEAFVGLVHRLDRPTGGVMVFARTSKAASRLSEQIQNKTFEKTYFAVLDGAPTHRANHLEHYLVKDERTNLVSVCGSGVKNAKKAVLNYEVVKTAENMSLAKVVIETGRSHQIRVQMSTQKTPLCGDVKYGSHVKAEGLALWATKISFLHPTTKTKMTFLSYPPMNAYPWNLFTEFDIENNL